MQSNNVFDIFTGKPEIETFEDFYQALLEYDLDQLSQVDTLEFQRADAQYSKLKRAAERFTMFHGVEVFRHVMDIKVANYGLKSSKQQQLPSLERCLQNITQQKETNNDD